MSPTLPFFHKYLYRHFIIIVSGIYMSDIETAIKLIKLRDDIDRSREQVDTARHRAHNALDNLSSRTSPLTVPNDRVQAELDESIAAVDHACAVMDKLYHEYEAALQQAGHDVLPYRKIELAISRGQLYIVKEPGTARATIGGSETEMTSNFEIRLNNRAVATVTVDHDAEDDAVEPEAKPVHKPAPKPTPEPVPEDIKVEDKEEEEYVPTKSPAIDKKEAIAKLQKVKGIGFASAVKLFDAGIDDIPKLRALSYQELKAIVGRLVATRVVRP